jgi:uncharacterized membrane protein YedE/YeeE
VSLPRRLTAALLVLILGCLSTLLISGWADPAISTPAVRIGQACGFTVSLLLAVGALILLSPRLLHRLAQ